MKMEIEIPNNAPEKVVDELFEIAKKEFGKNKEKYPVLELDAMEYKGWSVYTCLLDFAGRAIEESKESVELDKG